MKAGAADTLLKRPLLWGGGAAVAVTATALGAPLWAALSLAAVCLGWFWYRRSLVCALLTVAFLLSAVGYRHLYIDPTRSLDGEVDTLTAVVVEEPQSGKTYVVRVTSSAVLREHTRVSLLYYGEENPTLYATVTAKVRLYADEGGYATAQGAFVRAFPVDYAEEDMAVLGTTETAAHRFMQRVRQALLAPSRSALGTAESGILAAVCFGERSFLDAATTAAFRDSGLSHLLVVSGLHVSMVALALRRLLRRLGRHASCLLSVTGVWFFGWLVGFTPSVLRAATMCSLWLMGLWLFYRADGLNSLGFAALVVLAWQPYAVYNVSFQLSFAATFGVLLLAGRLTLRAEVDRDLPWYRRLWHSVRRTAVGGAAVCLSATFFTLPIAVYHFGGFSLATVVSNVLAVAPVGGMMALGWLGTLCGLVPFLGWLSRGLLLLAGLLARYIGWVARVCSPDWVWVSITRPWQIILTVGVCALAVCGILCRIPYRRLVAVLAFLAVTAVCVAAPLTTHPATVTVLSLDGEGAFAVTWGNHSVLLLTHGRELEEVAYNTTRLDPDVLFLGDSDGAALAQLRRYPDATVIATAEAARVAGDLPLTVCPTGGAVTLWEGCRLTLLSEEWWLLQLGTQRIRICVNPDAAPTDTADFCIYVGGTPTHPPQGPYAVVCTEAWLRRHHPTLTGREIFIVNDPTTLVPQGEEWRVLPWL